MTPKPLPAPRPWWRAPAARKAGFWTLLALAAGFILWLIFFFPYVTTDDARVAATLVRLAPQGDGGRVVFVAVDAGSPVTQGQVLVETDHAPAQARLSQAQAGAALARLDLTRAQKLFSQGAVPVSDLDRARAADEKAQAELSLAQSALADTYLKSPFDGTVLEKTTEVGDMLERGQTALTLADTAHAWVAANVEETSVGRVKVGQPARVTVDEGGALTGHVEEITAAAESQFSIIPMENPSGNFIKLVQRIPIRVSLDDPARLPLKAGESVEVRIRVR